MTRQTAGLATALAALLALSAPLAAQETGAEEAAPAETGTAETAPAETGTAETGTAESASAETEGAAAPADAGTVVATVNGTDITLGEVALALARLPQQYRQFPPEVIFDGVVDQLVQQQLLADSLGEVPERVDLALANERRSLLAGEVVNDIVSGAVTEEEVRAAYEERYAEAEPQQEYNASHILVETEETAQEVVSALEGGADFAELARERSQDPGSGANGGQLGWFGAGMMVEPFQQAVEGMEPGTVSEPVETQFGWHVIRLNETREQSAPAFEEVAGELEGELQQAAIEARLSELEAEAEITRAEPGSIDPSALQDPALLGE